MLGRGGGAESGKAANRWFVRISSDRVARDVEAERPFREADASLLSPDRRGTLALAALAVPEASERLRFRRCWWGGWVTAGAATRCSLRRPSEPLEMLRERDMLRLLVAVVRCGEEERAGRSATARLLRGAGC